MSDEKKTGKKQEEKVEIFVPRLSAKGDPNVMVGINGKNYVFPRGKKVMVPKAVADEVYRAQRAQAAFEDMSTALQEETDAQAKRANLK